MNRIKKIKTSIVLCILIEIICGIILWWLSQKSQESWLGIKNNDTLKDKIQGIEWNFWNQIWDSGKIMAVNGNITKLKNYQNQTIPNLIAKLFTTESITNNNSNNDALIQNFYSFNSYIQASVTTIVMMGITLLIILVLMSKLIWNNLINGNCSLAWIENIRRLQNQYQSWNLSNVLNKNLIEVKNLNFEINGNQILKNINLKIKKGSLNIIIGPNGSGKTTLLKNLINLQQSTQGEILWGGKKVSTINKTEFSRQVSYIPQFLNLNNPIAVPDLLEFARYPYKKLKNNSSEIDHAITMKALRLNHCSHFKDKMINELSEGQKKKVILTKVLIQETKVIVLDEPTSYLDVSNQYKFLEIISSFHKQGKTIIMILHDIMQSIKYADNLIVMLDGRIHSEGKPKQIINKNLLREVFQIECDIFEFKEEIKIKNIHAI